MFLDSEPEGNASHREAACPWSIKKRTATLLSATEKIYMFLSSSPSVTKGKPFFFSSVKGSVHSQALTCKSSFDMLICACNTAFILSRNYMHAWHAVPSCTLTNFCNVNRENEESCQKARRSLPSFHCSFIALTPTSYKSWSVHVRAKPCENQSLTESLFLTGFFVFSIYAVK